jgi:lysophospholipase L1-like esterase
MKALNGVPLPYANLGVPGETAASFLTGEQWPAFQAEVARAEAAGLPIYAVTASLGGNELLSARTTSLTDRQRALDEFRAAYEQAIDDIRSEIGPETPLVLTTYYDVSEGDASQQFTDAWWIAQFNKVIRDTAARHDAQVADLEPQFRGRVAELTRYPVDVHPTNQGFLAIAEAVWQALDFDQSAPEVEVSSPEQAERRTPTLRFTAVDQVGVSALAVVANGVEVRPIEIEPGVYVALLDLGIDPARPLLVEIEAGDAAGNVQRIEQQISFVGVNEGSP